MSRHLISVTYDGITHEWYVERENVEGDTLREEFARESTVHIEDDERIRDTDFEHPIGVTFVPCATCQLPVDLALPNLISSGGVHHTEHGIGAPASAYLPECPDCGAAPGQAHGPTCATYNP